MNHILNDRQVHRVARDAEEAGGDDYAFLHNMITSLSLACSVLCAFSAFAVINRSAHMMMQATAYQAVVATGLALCGVLSYGSSASIAAGEQQSGQRSSRRNLRLSISNHPFPCEEPRKISCFASWG